MILGPDSLNKNYAVNEKIQILYAHKLLVNQSNKRILDRIKEIKLGRHKVTVAEQEQVKDEQQNSITASALLTTQKPRLRKEKIRSKTKKRLSLN